RTATGFSVSGAELTGASGFTGISTIGGPTTSMSMMPNGSTGHVHQSYSVAEEEYDDEEDEDDEDDDVASAENSGYRRFSGASS
ncbi:hypothetical protein EV175_007690, partial [Coemansia sp. RSA 1933]